MKRLLEDFEDEVNSSSVWSMKLLEEDARKAVWGLCMVLGVDSNGIPSQACRLLERFLFNHMQDFMTPDVIDVDEWDDYKRSLAARIPLLMASCVQLAANMSSVGLQVNPSLVRTCLQCKGVTVSVADIINSEFQVFSNLGFRVPLWTSLEAAQMLAVEVGLPASALEGVALVLNIAEYRRDRVTAAVRAIAAPSPYAAFKGNPLSSLHLAAGAVTATVRFLALTTPDPVPRLAELTRAPACYVKCVCDVILADVLGDATDTTANNVVKKKRKRSH